MCWSYVGYDVGIAARNPTEHEIYPALINIKMPTLVTS